MAKVGLVFPGQGVQSVGMGGDFHESSELVRSLFAEAGDILEMDIAGLCLRGPQAALDETLHTQLAVLTVDIAVYSLFREEGGADAVVMAGHSLGEYAALYAAGAIGFADVLRLVKKRAIYHREAVPQGEGAMAAVIGPPAAEVAEMCKITENSHRYLQIAFAEELKMMCQKIGVSFDELRAAMNTKWNVDLPEARQGIGRHCLPKDIRYVTSLTPSLMLDSAIKVDQQYREWLAKRKT